MPEWLRNAVVPPVMAPLEVQLIRFGLAFLFGLAVAGVYFATHRRDATYQPTFIATLVLLTILITLVTQVIGESVARAFSLVGALSIVRFRTVVQDTRDTAFVIFAVVLGMAIGDGHLQIAIVGLVAGSLAAFVLRPWRMRGPNPRADWSLLVRVGLGQDPALLEPILSRYLENQQPTGAATSRQGSALDLSFRVRLTRGTSPTALVAELNQVEGVQHVELHQM